jgi:glycosyltransferase involved in cell wall biosynthesis
MTPPHPRVSVIMPAYNTEQYMPAAIRSALAQTIDDLELIVVDDGSEDATLATALQFAERDPRVRVMTQANAGTSAARNLAMGVARGDFFACLDSDDEWMPRFLEEQLDVLTRRPGTAIVTANAINRGGHLDGTLYWSAQHGERVLSVVEMLEREDSVCIMSVFRRAVFEVAGPFDESLNGNEDYEFWLRAVQAGFELVQTFTPLAYYRRRSDSMSANDRQMAAGIIRVFQMVRARSPRSDEHAAIDRQLERFERELLAIDARTALRQRDFPAAASSYQLLYRKSPAPRLAALLFAVRHAPRTVLWLADARRALRRVGAPHGG